MKGEREMELERAWMEDKVLEELAAADHDYVGRIYQRSVERRAKPVGTTARKVEQISKQSENLFNSNRGLADDMIDDDDFTDDHVPKQRKRKVRDASDLQVRFLR